MNKLHKWVEYHKWKFKGKTYTPLMDPVAHPKCLVLMTRTEFGLLGHYNEFKKSPFGTFDVGGDLSLIHIFKASSSVNCALIG